MFRGTRFLSGVAVLGSVEQMGLISDRAHTIYKGVEGVYFCGGAVQIPLARVETFAQIKLPVHSVTFSATPPALK